MQDLELESDQDIPLEVPSYEWLRENFKNRSAAIRYLSRELGLPITIISGSLDVPYRQVYGVVARMKKQSIPEHVCPVCKNRRG